MIKEYNHLIYKGYFKSQPKNTKILDIVFPQLLGHLQKEMIDEPKSVQNKMENTITGYVIFKKGYAVIHTELTERPYPFILDIFTPSKISIETITNQSELWFGLEKAEWHFIQENKSENAKGKINNTA